MFIANATYKTISTEGQTFPIAEGTIISNGIVPQTIDIEPPTHRISVAIGGTINLNSEANKNVSFTNEQIRALGGDFDFVPAEEKPEKNELPAYTTSDNGKVLTVDGTGTTAALEWAEGGGGGLPEYTSEDAGKVLTVNEDADGVEWKAANGGYDAIISIYHPGGSASISYEYTLESGSFSSVKALLDDNVSPVILVKVFDELAMVYASSVAVAFYYWEGAITMVAKIPSSFKGSATSVKDWFHAYGMRWNSDDTIEPW